MSNVDINVPGLDKTTLDGEGCHMVVTAGQPTTTFAAIIGADRTTTNHHH